MNKNNDEILSWFCLHSLEFDGEDEQSCVEMIIIMAEGRARELRSSGETKIGERKGVCIIQIMVVDMFEL